MGCVDPPSFSMLFPAFWFFVHLEMVLCQILSNESCTLLCAVKIPSLCLRKIPSVYEICPARTLGLCSGFGTEGLTKHAAPSSLSVMGSSSTFGTVHVTAFFCALVLALSLGLQMRTHWQRHGWYPSHQIVPLKCLWNTCRTEKYLLFCILLDQN